MILNGARGQQQIDDLYDASGVIATGGTAQLVLPQSKSRSQLLLENISTGSLLFQIGIRPATATLTNGVVTSVAVVDAGFGFLTAPDIIFLGGGNSNDMASLGATMPDWPAPYSPAVAHCVMTTSTLGGLQISLIVVDNGGSGYLAPPYVAIRAKRTDPLGVGIPSATVGILLVAGGGQASWDATGCPTSAVSVFGANTSQPYTCKWMT